MAEIAETAELVLALIGGIYMAKEILDNAKHAREKAKELIDKLDMCIEVLRWFHEWLKQSDETHDHLKALIPIGRSLERNIETAKAQHSKYQGFRGVWSFRRYTAGGDMKQDMTDTLTA